MRQSSNKVFKNNLGKIIFDIILIILGLMFIIFPSIFVNSIGIIAGTILIVVGILGIILALITSSFLFSSIFSIIFSIMSLCFGITFVVNPSLLVSILPVFVIIYLLFSGFSKIFSFAKLRNDRYYIINLIVGILFIVLGITLMFFIDEFNSITAILFGVLLLFFGLSSLVEIIVKLIDKNKNEKHVEKKIIGGFKGKEDAIDADIIDIKDSEDK